MHAAADQHEQANDTQRPSFVESRSLTCGQCDCNFDLVKACLLNQSLGSPDCKLACFDWLHARSTVCQFPALKLIT